MQKSLHTPGYERFRVLLRETREAAGVTQVELGRRLGEGQDFVSKCERGVRRLDVVELHQWCHALGVPFLDFVEQLNGRLPRPRKTR